MVRALRPQVHGVPCVGWADIGRGHAVSGICTVCFSGLGSSGGVSGCSNGRSFLVWCTAYSSSWFHSMRWRAARGGGDGGAVLCQFAGGHRVLAHGGGRLMALVRNETESDCEPWDEVDDCKKQTRGSVFRCWQNARKFIEGRVESCTVVQRNRCVHSQVSASGQRHFVWSCCRCSVRQLLLDPQVRRHSEPILCIESTPRYWFGMSHNEIEFLLNSCGLAVPS
mmetsp:Transcript_14581/g.39740  ORF Transcript_14581/g.39740 Transcript_14581/m.39740 type:complete len:224 (+) Transcript_14581:851-1522(+)